jgi:hypothetical protein
MRVLTRNESGLQVVLGALAGGGGESSAQDIKPYTVVSASLPDLLLSTRAAMDKNQENLNEENDLIAACKPTQKTINNRFHLNSNSHPLERVARGYEPGREREGKKRKSLCVGDLRCGRSQMRQQLSAAPTLPRT